MSRKRIFAFAAALVAVALVSASASAMAAEAPARPRIGLVLGGGGARGAAHIGVLEVLEEMRIPVDCVAGTSMGALVGGAYAAGITPQYMKERIAATDWTDIFVDNPTKDAVNLRRKQLDERFYSGLEFGVGRDGLSFREGAFTGEKVKLFFNDLVGTASGERSIEQLLLPLSIIATDIGTGERVVLRTGSLTQAMRASMSAPGFITPVEANGRKLVDGGLVDNVPIAEARERCADIVIAVDVGTPLLKPAEVKGVVSLATQVVNLLTNQNVVQSIATLKPDDILIRPDLTGLSATDFTRQDQAIVKGHQAALTALEPLRKYALSPEEYRNWYSALRRVDLPPPLIDEIQVAEMKRVNPEVVLKHLRVEEGEPLDTRTFNKGLARLYGEGDFQSVDYALLYERGKNILRVTPVEKPWGPDYLRFGVNLRSDFSELATYSLRAMYRRTWLNSLGAEWTSILQIGSENQFATDWYQPLNPRQDVFVQPALAVGNRTFGLFVDGRRLADYHTQEARLTLDTGVNIGTIGQVKGGWLQRSVRANVITGAPELGPLYDTGIGGPRFQATFDTYDALYFPTRGWGLDVNYFQGVTGFGREQRYSKASAEWGAATTLGRWFNMEAALGAGGSPKGSLPLFDAFTLGGAQRLSGFADGQLIGDDYLLGRLTLYRKLIRASSTYGLNVYLGTSFESGKMKLRYSEPALSGWQNSYSIYLAADSILGPVYTGVSYAPGQKARWYLFLGTP